MKRLIVRIGLGMVMGGLVWGGLLANQARATDVTFHFTGLVTNVGSNLVAPFAENQILTGDYTFSTSTTNTGGATVGIYPGTISNLSFQLDTYSGAIGVSTPSTPRLIVVTNNAFLIGDAYIVASSFSGATNNSRNPVAFEIDLSGGTGGFGSSALPTTPPSLGDFANPDTFRVIFDGTGPFASRRVKGTLTSLTAVPLPAAVILFGAGLIALVGLGAGSWRKRNNSLA